MALDKIQTIIQKISNSGRLKKVIAEVQTVKSDLQSQMKKLNTDSAVRRYKAMMKKVLEKEKLLQNEISQVVATVKKSASDVEKNFKAYKTKAQAQRTKLEKMIKKELGKVKAQTTKKSTPAKKAKTTKRKAAKTKRK
jgi:hypothetical protein